MDFPRMLYRFPGTGRESPVLQDGKYDTHTVVDSDAMREAQNSGWSISPAKAKLSYADIQAVVAKITAEVAADKALEAARTLVAAADNASPTRAELEEKATALGIKFDGRTSDKALSDRIAAALET